jgi:hypothetical protein
MTTHDNMQPDPTRNEDTEQVDRADATRPLEVGPEEKPRQGVADLLGDEDEGQGAPGAGDRPAPPAQRTSTATIPDPPPAPRGPHGPAILLGIVCLAVAGLVLAQELGELTLDWGDIGPLGIALTGGVLVLFGLLGLATSRRKDT